jgi:hypothetical protein
MQVGDYIIRRGDWESRQSEPNFKKYHVHKTGVITDFTNGGEWVKCNGWIYWGESKCYVVRGVKCYKKLCNTTK